MLTTVGIGVPNTTLAALVLLARLQRGPLRLMRLPSGWYLVEMAFDWPHRHVVSYLVRR